MGTVMPTAVLGYNVDHVCNQISDIVFPNLEIKSLLCLVHMNPGQLDYDDCGTGFGQRGSRNSRVLCLGKEMVHRMQQ